MHVEETNTQQADIHYQSNQMTPQISDKNLIVIPFNTWNRITYTSQDK